MEGVVFEILLHVGISNWFHVVSGKFFKDMFGWRRESVTQEKEEEKGK